MKEYWRMINTAFSPYVERWGLAPILAKIAASRVSLDQTGDYLDRTGPLPDPFQMKDMTAAVDCILAHLEAKDRIDICGDYDVDGLCSSVILARTLRLFSDRIFVHIPDRVEDGYGLRPYVVEECVRNGSGLIVTCDNGISEREAAERADQLQIDFIITDHHDIPMKDGREWLPRAGAILNPKREGETYPFHGLCGAGVALQLARAIRIKKGLPEEPDLLGYASLATVCDVMSLVGDNRRIVYQGMAQWKKKPPLFIASLMKAAGLEKLSVYGYGFVLGPMLNSGGRLESQREFLPMMLEEDPQKAMEGAIRLYELNRRRQDLTQKGLEQALEQLKLYEKDRIKVIYLPQLHESLAGLVAAKIKEKTYRPALVITGRGEQCKGSGRSIPGYSMYEELSRMPELFIRYGGHPMAAGLSIREENIETLRICLNENETLTEKELYPQVRIDMELPMDYATLDLTRMLEVLEPCGNGNPRPLFAEKGMVLNAFRWIGRKKKAARLILSKNGRTYEAMLFQVGMLQDLLQESGREKLWDHLITERPLMQPLLIDVCYQVSVNSYLGTEQAQIVLTNIRCSF